jgi:hypothetical protein
VKAAAAAFGRAGPLAAGAVALALGLRLRHATWGLPLEHGHIDESIVVFYAVRALAGEPDPAAFFDYPGLFLYWLAALFRAAAWAAGLSVEQAVGAHLQGAPGLFLTAGRALSAALGALSVWLVYRLALRVGKTSAAGPAVLAAFLLALNRLHVLHGHYATADAAAACFSLAAVDQIVRTWEEPAAAAGALAAACVGLAAALKYYPGLLAALLIAAPWALKLPRPGRLAALWTAVAAATFFLGSPYSALAPARFLERGAHLFSRIAAPGGGGFLPLWPTLKGLFANAGPAALACAAFGLWELLRRDKDRAAAVCAAAAGLTVLFFGLWRVQSEHYVLLAYPVLYLFAAHGAFRLGRFHRALPAAAGALLLVWAAAPTCRQLRVLARPDTRLAALSWVRENVPAGSRILRFAHTPEFTPRDAFAVRVDWENKRLAGDGSAALSGFDLVLYGTYDPAGDAALAALRARLGEATIAFEDPGRRFPHHPSVFVFKGDPVPQAGTAPPVRQTGTTAGADRSGGRPVPQAGTAPPVRRTGTTAGADRSGGRV